MPAILVWALGTVGALLLIKLLNREWQRVNADLDRVQPVRSSDPERAGATSLERDPSSGEYRVKR